MANTDTVGKTIIEWAATRIDEAVIDPKAGYYPFSVLAEAYEKGIEHNQDAFKTKLRKKHFDNANLVVESIASLSKILTQNEIIPTKLFVSISVLECRILFGIKEDIYISDSFSDIAYTASAITKLEYFDKGLGLQIGFLNDNKNLNIDLIKSDGYDIALDIQSGNEL